MAESTSCRSCGSAPELGAYATPLCTRCRDTLSKRGVPPWVRALCLLIGVIFIVSLWGFPATVGAGISFERGQRAEARGDYGAAVHEYEKTVKRFPDSTLPLARLGIASVHARQFSEADVCFQELSGRQTSAELANEVNAAIEELNSDRRRGSAK